MEEENNNKEVEENKEVQEKKEFDIKNIFNELVYLMKVAGEMKNLKGHEKKKYVLEQLAIIIPWDNYIEEILLFVIDLLIEVENGKLVINKRAKKASVNCLDCLKEIIKTSRKNKNNH